MMGVHIMLESFILLSESVLGNYHLGPHSPIAVWAILGALRSPVSDVCCWVNLQLRRPGPATSDGINRRAWRGGRDEEEEDAGRRGAGGGNGQKIIQILQDDRRM